MPVLNWLFFPAKLGNPSRLHSKLLLYIHRDGCQLTNLSSPLLKDSHRRIRPASIPGFLRRRNLHWECFCPLLTTAYMPVRFVNKTGRLIAVCHHNTSKCGFSCK